MKVKLIAKDAGPFSYSGMENVELGTIFNAFPTCRASLVDIKGSDLISSGGDPSEFSATHSYSFYINSEVEIVEG